MSSSSRVRVSMGCSFHGFIAGPDHDISWLEESYSAAGDLVRQALNAGLVDEITGTFLPVLLGNGVRLFDDLVSRTKLQFVAQRAHEGGFLQVTVRVRKTGPY